MNRLNELQRVSLVTGTTSFTYWILSALDNGFEIFKSYRWDNGFDEWYLQLSFAIFIGSIVSFFVFASSYPIDFGRPKNRFGNSLGFGWGRFFIGTSFLQGIAASFLFIADEKTNQIPNRWVALLLAIICLSMAYGLYKRRVYGIVIFYFIIAISSAITFIGIYDGSIKPIIALFQMIIIAFWLKYFNKRENMFS